MITGDGIVDINRAQSCRSRTVSTFTAFGSAVSCKRMCRRSASRRSSFGRDLLFVLVVGKVNAVTLNAVDSRGMRRPDPRTDCRIENPENETPNRRESPKDSLSFRSVRIRRACVKEKVGVVLLELLRFALSLGP